MKLFKVRPDEIRDALMLDHHAFWASGRARSVNDISKVLRLEPRWLSRRLCRRRSVLCGRDAHARRYVEYSDVRNPCALRALGANIVRQKSDSLRICEDFS